jgi:hypothetical protein
MASAIQLRPLDRQLLHLLGIDIAAETRTGDVKKRSLRADRNGFLERRDRHLQVDRHGLADEQLHAGPRNRRKALQFRGQLVSADACGHAVDTALVCDRHESVACRLVDGGHSDARQCSSGGVGDRAGERCFLCQDRLGEGQ